MGRTNWEKSKQGVRICKKSTNCSLCAPNESPQLRHPKLLWHHQVWPITSPSSCASSSARGHLSAPLNFVKEDFERLFSLLNWTHHRWAQMVARALHMCSFSLHSACIAWAARSFSPASSLRKWSSCSMCIGDAPRGIVQAGWWRYQGLLYFGGISHKFFS